MRSRDPEQAQPTARPAPPSMHGCKRVYTAFYPFYGIPEEVEHVQVETVLD